jgi:hypothetical protein
MSKRMQRELIDRSGRLVRRHTPLSLAIATALALPGLAAAQEAPAAAGDQELEEIVVTGFRQALQSSIEVKREAMSRTSASCLTRASQSRWRVFRASPASA